jgi:hypothetical protein
MSVILVPPVTDELQDAIVFYNDQLAGLGDRFYLTFRNAAGLIDQNPELWRKVGEHTRRANLGWFPYFLLYVINGADILVTCVAHHHRNPEYYVGRIR